VLLAELVQSSGSAVAKVIALLALGRIFDLVCLGHLLGRRLVIRNRFVLANLEVVGPATGNKVTECSAELRSVDQFVGGDEQVDAVVDRRHLKVLKVWKIRKFKV